MHCNVLFSGMMRVACYSVGRSGGIGMAFI